MQPKANVRAVGVATVVAAAVGVIATKPRLSAATATPRRQVLARRRRGWSPKQPTHRPMHRVPRTAKAAKAAKAVAVDVAVIAIGASVNLKV